MRLILYDRRRGNKPVWFNPSFHSYTNNYVYIQAGYVYYRLCIYVYTEPIDGYAFIIIIQQSIPVPLLGKGLFSYG